MLASEYIRSLDKEIRVISEKKEAIENLLKEFPDLEVMTRSRSGAKYFVSKSRINSANEISIYHSCSCCSNPVLRAHPYIKYNGETIYCTEDAVSIGEKCSWGHHDMPDEDWESRLKSLGLNDSIIEMVRKYFEENGEPHPDEDYDDY